jgi:hypothetical protein
LARQNKEEQMNFNPLARRQKMFIPKEYNKTSIIAIHGQEAQVLCSFQVDDQGGLVHSGQEIDMALQVELPFQIAKNLQFMDGLAQAEDAILYFEGDVEIGSNTLKFVNGSFGIDLMPGIVLPI